MHYAFSTLFGWAGNTDHFFNHSVEGFGGIGVGGCVIDLFALPAAYDQPGGLQKLQVMGQGGAAHARHGGQIDDALLAVAQKPVDPGPVRVAEELESIGYCGKHSHIGHVLHQMQAVRPVIMGKGSMGHGKNLLFAIISFLKGKNNPHTGNFPCFLGGNVVSLPQNN
jgi:hypothetical protein